MVRAFSSWPNLTLINTKVKRARRSNRSRNWMEVGFPNSHASGLDVISRSKWVGEPDYWMVTRMRRRFQKAMTMI